MKHNRLTRTQLASIYFDRSLHPGTCSPLVSLHDLPTQPLELPLRVLDIIRHAVLRPHLVYHLVPPLFLVAFT